MKQRTFCSRGFFRNTFSRLGWLGLVNGILFFLALPVTLLLGLQGGSDRVIAMAEALQLKEGYFTVWGVLSLQMGFVTAWGVCWYLHDRRQVVFYHSQPIARSSLYLTRLLAGFLWFILGVLPSLLLSGLVLSLAGVPGAWGRLAAAFAYMVMNFLLVYGITALTAPLSGSPLSHLEVTFFVLAMPAFAGLAVRSLFTRFFRTFVPMTWETTLLQLSPPAWSILLPYEGGSHGWFILYIAAGLLLPLPGAWLTEKYPSEAAGSTLPYPFTRTILRLPTMFVLSVALGSFFRLLGEESLPLEGLGYALGIVLAHMYCQGRFHQDFRAVFRGWKSLLLFAAGMLALLLVLGCDLLGYDRWLPAPEAVASSAVRMSVEGYEYTGDTANDADWTALTLALAGSSDGQQGNPVHITWKLKNGMGLQRQYNLPATRENAERLCELLTSPGFRRNTTAEAMLQDCRESDHVEIDWSDGLYIRSGSSDKPTAEAFLEAWLQDLEEVGYTPDAGVWATVYLEVQQDNELWHGSVYNVYGNWKHSRAVLEAKTVPLTAETAAGYTILTEDGADEITDSARKAAILNGFLTEDELTWKGAFTAYTIYPPKSAAEDLKYNEYVKYGMDTLPAGTALVPKE